MSGIPNISGSTSQTASSGATGGALDTQGRYTFGGIQTGGSSNGGAQSYVAMGLVAVVAIAALILALGKR